MAESDASGVESSVMSEEHEKLAPVIVKLTAAAAGELAAIESECNTPPWSKRLFEQEFVSAHARVFGARVSGLIVGFLVARVVLDEAHIVNFGVRRLLRARGVGRAMLMHILRELHSETVRWAVLEVRKSNDAAQRLYASLGFVETGRRAAYYVDNREDAILMSLDLVDFISRMGEESQVAVG